MNFTTISHTKNSILPIRYGSYTDINGYVDHTFYWGMNDLKSASLHILTYSVNNLTLAVI